MPSAKFLSIQKLYTTLGLNALSRMDVTYLLKRLQRADTLIEKINKQGYLEKDDITVLRDHVREE